MKNHKLYYTRFYNLSAECRSHKEAFVITEARTFIETGHHKFSNYNSFKAAKSRFLRHNGFKQDLHHPSCIIL